MPCGPRCPTNQRPRQSQDELWNMSPDVAHRENNKFRETSRPIDPDSFCVCAQMPAAGQAIAAATANYVPFSAHQLPNTEIGNVRTDRGDLANKFVPDDERHGNGLLRPIVPLVDMEIG